MRQETIMKNITTKIDDNKLKMEIIRRMKTKMRFVKSSKLRNISKKKDEAHRTNRRQNYLNTQSTYHRQNTNLRYKKKGV